MSQLLEVASAVVQTPQHELLKSKRRNTKYLLYFVRQELSVLVRCRKGLKDIALVNHPVY